MRSGKGDSRNASAPRVLCTLLLLLLAAQAVLVPIVYREGRGDVLLAIPDRTATPVAPRELEKAAENRFLAASVARARGTVRALQAEWAVDVVGTGAGYRELLAYPLLAGGFFTESACETRSRHAVLNHMAAHALFGGMDVTGQAFTMDGMSWRVVGVMDDGDIDGARIYIPHTLTDGQVDHLYALADGEAGTAAVLSALQGLGINRETDDFWHLGQLRNAFGWRFGAAWRLAAGAALLLVLCRLARRLRSDNANLRKALQSRYFRELLQDRRCAGWALRFMTVPASCGAALFCAVGVAERFLLLRDAVKGFWRLDAAAYGGAVEGLWKLHMLGSGLFLGFAAVLVLWVSASLSKGGVKRCGSAGSRLD